MGAVVNHGLPSGASGAGEVAVIHRLPPVLRQALSDALNPAFVAATVVALLVWAVAVLGVKEVTLRRSVDDVAGVEAAAAAPAEAR